MPVTFEPIEQIQFSFNYFKLKGNFQLKITQRMNPSQSFNQSGIQDFYNEFGIKQYNCFSGGYRYLEKQKLQQKPIQQSKPQVSRQDLYRQFGLTNAKVKTYKLDNQYVPETKSELADKLMEKIEHQRKKMRYYREKYHGDYVNQYEGKYRQ